MGVLLGISGLAGSGKDTVADWFVKNRNFAKVAFADPIKRVAADIFEFTDEQLYGPSEDRNAPDLRYLQNAELNQYLTPRQFLQFFGTEIGRTCYNRVWIDYALRIAHKILKNPTKYEYTAKLGLVECNSNSSSFARYLRNPTPYNGVVISDVRFSNELNILKEHGKVCRVIRGSGLTGTAGAHASEAEQQTIPDSEFDFVIDNNGTLDELYLKLEGLKL